MWIITCTVRVSAEGEHFRCTRVFPPQRVSLGLPIIGAVLSVTLAGLPDRRWERGAATITWERPTNAAS